MVKPIARRLLPLTSYLLSHASRITYYALHFALVLVIIGYLGPWIPHKAAGLTVTGAGLAEFARLFGSPHIVHELFFTPLLAGAILLGLLVNQPTNKPTTPLRVLLTLVAALLALGALPSYQFLRNLDYRCQLRLAGTGAGLALLTFLAGRLPRRVWGIFVSLAALAGIVPALWQYARFRPLVATLYDAPVGIGWGLIVCTVGFALLLAYGGTTVFSRQTPVRGIHPAQGIPGARVTIQAGD